MTDPANVAVDISAGLAMLECVSGILMILVSVYLSHGSYGILHVQCNGVYGTVCDDNFDLNSNGCTVVCRQLGYTSVIIFICFILLWSYYTQLCSLSAPSCSLSAPSISLSDPPVV